MNMGFQPRGTGFAFTWGRGRTKSNSADLKELPVLSCPYRFRVHNQEPVTRNQTPPTRDQGTGFFCFLPLLLAFSIAVTTASSGCNYFKESATYSTFDFRYSIVIAPEILNDEKE
jgi:hypothetical protein